MSTTPTICGKRKVDSTSVNTHGYNLNNKKVMSHLEMELFDKGLSYMMYYSKSADCALFDGVKEWCNPNENRDKYYGLTVIPHFRRMLSAFHVTRIPIEFKIDLATRSRDEGKIETFRFASMEHNHHFLKYILHNREYAMKFTINSGSDFCKDPAKAKKAGGKSGGVPLNKVQLDQSNQLISKHSVEMYMAKYDADSTAYLVLMRTLDIQLTHFTGRGGTHVLEHDHMTARSLLRKQAPC